MSWYYNKPKKIAIKSGEGIRGGGKYGTTWWGQQWLNAFTAISDSNRLPRGRTYANNGSVSSIHFKDNQIDAVVLGSQKYKVAITVSAFGKTQSQQVVDMVSSRPDLLSSLLNRALPEELLELCEEEGIQLFPKKWSDLSAHCSCPDYAMPCKHLAAIIYLVANEIDKNPFKVFDLHGLDLAAVLSKKGILQATEKAAAPPAIDELKAAADVSFPTMDERVHWQHIDLSRLAEISIPLGEILSDRPLFYLKGDFKAVFLKTHKKISSQLEKETKKLEEALDAPYQRVDSLEIWVSPEGHFLEMTAWDREEAVLFESTSCTEMIRWLSGLPAGRLAHFSPELRGLWLVMRYAQALVRQGAYLPQIKSVGQETYGIRWVPASMNEEVAIVQEQLQAILPPYLLLYKEKEEMLPPVPKDYLNALSSVFLQHFVASYSGLEGSSDEIEQLFFTGKIQGFSSFTNKEYPAGIQQWLSRFFMADKRYVPLLEVIEESDEVFSLSVLIEDREDQFQVPIPLADIFSKTTYEDIRISVLKDVANIANLLPALKTTLQKKGKYAPRYAAQDFAQILLEQLPVIRLFGIRLLLPKALSKLIRPKLSLSLSLSEGSDKVLGTSLLGLQELLRYNWRAAIGEQFIPLEAFKALVQKSSGLVKIRGEYVYFDERETALLLEKLNNPPRISNVELLQVALSEEYEGSPIALSPALLQRLKALSEIKLLPAPDHLQATLRPYQARGFSWLYKNMQLGLGSLLADDMGLGKTLQVIALLQSLKNNGDVGPQQPVLVVAPTTLLTNWKKEIEKFAPQLATAIYHGSQRDLKALAGAEVVITTYGTARSDVSKINQHKWQCLVIDEAQNIKNNSTAQSKAIKSIQADHYIALSGTPVENRLSEYWSIFDFTNKGYLGTPAFFKYNFAIPIEADRDQRVLRRFHKMTAPFIMRRLKTDKSIISDLPDKVEINQYCQLTPEQAALYEGIVEESMKAIEANDGKARNGLVLNLIMALKQICNHPAQYLKKGKADPLLSGKCPLLLQLVETALDNDEKVIIFTQFREMGELLVKILNEQLGLSVPFLHGGTSRAKRDEMVEDFQQKNGAPVMLLSLKAAGTGLNLTAASQVVHFDLWWNPAVEAQATDRAFRIGQKKKVVAHRFITTATFEERIDSMIQQKKELAQLSVASGEQWIGELSNTELRQLFSLAK